MGYVTIYTLSLLVCGLLLNVLIRCRSFQEVKAKALLSYKHFYKMSFHKKMKLMAIKYFLRLPLSSNHIWGLL